MKSYKPSLRSAVVISLTAVTLLLSSCKPKAPAEMTNPTRELKLSLAQWSIHRSLENGTLKAEDFAAIAKNDFGITAIEYVNGFYRDHATDAAFWTGMRAKADSLGVTSLLIMVDDEGDLGNPDDQARLAAVENHYKWVDAASILGCHSIRVNAFGEGNKDSVKVAMIEALKRLSTYAASKNINVLIENHGLYSSDGQWVADVIKQVNMANCGTLPDFGNWCTSAKWGSTQEGKDCAEVYDRYQGVAELLPFAKSVSAKSYKFDDAGNETVMDYSRLLKIVYDSDFEGYIGIEYEGDPLSEPDGIRATKALVEREWQQQATPQ